MKHLYVLLSLIAISVSGIAQNVGIGNTSPNSKLDVSGDLALREGTALTVSAGANTLTLPAAKNSIYRLTGASGAFSISSISAGNDGMLLTLINATGQVMTVTNGTIQTNTGADLVASGTTSSVNLIYNATLAKWLVVSGEGFIQASTTTNIYNTDGTLTGNRTVTQGANSLTLNSTSGTFKYATTGTGSVTLGNNLSATGSNNFASGNSNSINGNYSFATGNNNTISGGALAAAIFGSSNIASADHVAVFGDHNIVSGFNSMAVGYLDTISGLRSLAVGQANNIGGSSALSVGFANQLNGFAGLTVGSNNIISNNDAMVTGTSNTANGLNTFAAGNANVASGNQSFALGQSNNAGGSNAGTLGNGLQAPSFSEVAVGTYNTTYSPASATAYSATDRIFNVGNGANSGSRSDAFTILKNGNVGIGNNTPTSKLQVSGTTSTTNLQMTNGATANYILQSDASGNGTWVAPSSIAANNIYNTDGTLTANRTLTQGTNSLTFTSTTGKFNFTTATGNIAMGNNVSSIGNNSVAMGSSTTALGNSSVAMGSGTTAFGDFSTAMGVGAYASGNYASTAIGSSDTASGTGSTAIGYFTAASGINSTAMGINTTARSYGEIALGSFNSTYTPSSTSSWVVTDRLFDIGNGTSSSTRSDALVILKNGNIGIGYSSPTSKLQVNGTTSTTNLQMTSGATSGYILQSDASGNGTWVNPNTITTATTNTLTNTTNTITSTVNGVAATAPAVNTVSNTSAANTLSTTVNGVPGTGVNIINSNVLSLSGTTVTSTINGVASNALDISSVDKNIYNSDGTLTGNRTVTMVADNINFSSTNGNFKYTTSGTGNVAMGNTLTATGSNAFATGYNNTVSGSNSFVTGNTNSASGNNAFVSGQSNNASGVYTFISGSQNTVSGSNAFATGNSNNVSGNTSLAAGKNNTVTATYSIVGGISNTDNGSDDIVGGTNNYIASGYGHTIAAGIDDTVKGSAGAVFGYQNTISNFEAFAQGDKNTASGQTSAVFGSSNNSAGANSFVTGYTDTALAYQSFAAGTGNIAESWSEMVIGANGTTYTPANTTGWAATDRVFNVGNGATSTTRSDAFTILKNGKVGIGTATPSAVLQVAGGGAQDFIVGNGGTNPQQLLLGNNGTSGSQIQAVHQGVAYDNLTLNASGGNVGIGLVSPAYTLDVNGVINAATGFKVAGGTPSTSTYLKGNGTNFVAGTIQPADLSAAISGTTGYHARFTGANTLSNGIIYDNGTGLAINNGTTVAGTISLPNTGANITWGATYTSIYDNANIHYWTDDVTNYESGATGTGAVFNWNAGVSATGTGGSTWMKLINGLLGIGTGTSTPGNTLSVNGSGGFWNNNQINFYTDAGSTQKGYVGLQSGQDFMLASTTNGNWMRIGANNANIAFFPDNTITSGATPKVVINSTGRVGIGTQSPGYPLDVENPYGNLGSNGASFRYYNVNQAGGATSASDISIYASNRIWATEFDAYSDSRIKKDRTSSDPAADLELIKALRPVEFRYIDAVQHGSDLKKGFIAQEVMQVYPQAVQTATDFIPSVYQMADCVVFDPITSALHVTLSKPHGLKVGDKVKTISAGSGKIVNVVSAVESDTQFTLSQWSDNTITELFIYGKEVPDFHTVDYDRIYTLNVSATQELAKQVAELKQANNSLKARNEQLEKAISCKANTSDVDQLKAEIEALKAFIYKTASSSTK